MQTSHTPSTASGTRAPLRLALTPGDRKQVLDGAWWPHSRDLPTELADLVDHFPTERARISRVVFSPPDWDGAQRRVQVEGRHVKAGSFPSDDTHVVVLRTSDRTYLTLLVVPPTYTTTQGEEAMLAAATPGNHHSASALLTEATEHDDTDTDDHWSDDGGTWWEEGTEAPSFR
jgi:hypothetical protein